MRDALVRRIDAARSHAEDHRRHQAALMNGRRLVLVTAHVLKRLDPRDHVRTERDVV